MSGFYEFFAGGGMARMGLGPEWSCLFAQRHRPEESRELHPELGRFGVSTGGRSRTSHYEPARGRRLGDGLRSLVRTSPSQATGPVFVEMQLRRLLASFGA